MNPMMMGQRQNTNQLFKVRQHGRMQVCSALFTVSFLHMHAHAHVCLHGHTHMHAHTQDEWEALQVVQYKDRLANEEHLLIASRESSKYAVTSAKKKQ